MVDTTQDMIINRNFKKSRKADKATALLALHAEKEEKYDRCLNIAEMASLVDAQCTKEEIGKYMRHLSGCGKCYGEWLELKTMGKTADNAVKERKHPMRRMKKYGFIGSGLALAASVVLFINLSHRTYMEKDTPSLEVVPMESQQRSAAPQFDRQADTQRKSKRIVPAEKESLLEMKGLSTPVPHPAAPTADTTEQAELYSERSAQLDVESWLATLQENCLSGRQDAEFWAKMAMQGSALLEKQVGSLPEDTTEKVSAALALLNGMGTKSVTDQCGHLLALLAEQEKSR